MNDKDFKFGDLAVRQLIQLEKEAFEGINKCRMSLAQIGKRFLSYALSINACDYDKIRSKYIEETNDNDVSENENDFYKDIADRYLWLDQEPKDKVLECFYQARDDLDNIDSQLNYIAIELQRLEDKKKSGGWLNGEERYNRNLLEYYRDKNRSAKNEILKFISEDIESFALSRCTKSSLSTFFSGSLPYKYSRGLMFHKELDQYDVRNMTVMSNKFLDFPIPTYREIKNIYINDKEKFYAFAKDYIEGGNDDIKQGISKIKECIECNHIIANRKDIILTIVNHYQNEDFISVVNMLPMQIEGIFHDICIEIGIDESRLDISSINEKLRMIQSHVTHFIYFEYYSFKFPVIRNLVAHGKLIEGDIEQTAIMLMLDLLPVCELAMSEEIPVVNKITLLKKILSDDFSCFIEYFGYKNINIPSFYQLNDEEKIVESKFNSEEFWAYLECEVKKEGVEGINSSETMGFIRKLHASKICRKKSDNFLKSMPSLIEEMKMIECNKKDRRVFKNK